MAKSPTTVTACCPGRNSGRPLRSFVTPPEQLTVLYNFILRLQPWQPSAKRGNPRDCLDNKSRKTMAGCSGPVKAGRDLRHGRSRDRPTAHLRSLILGTCSLPLFAPFSSHGLLLRHGLQARMSLHLEDWIEDVVVANTHWADVYGNDYGSGGPLTVRSGRGKLEGYMTIHPGFEEKSLAIEVCLPRNDMLALLANEHFKKLLGMPMFPNAPNT